MVLFLYKPYNFEQGMLGNWQFLKEYNLVCLVRVFFESLGKGVQEGKRIAIAF